MSAIKNIVGPRVREIRKNQGLTQDELSARLQIEGLEDINRVVVAKIESQIRCVNDYEIAIIANALQVDLKQLFPAYDDIASMVQNKRISVKRAKR